MLGFVHFVPVGGYEAPIADIYSAYGSPAAGALALAVLSSLLISVALLALVALRARRASVKLGERRGDAR